MKTRSPIVLFCAFAVVRLSAADTFSIGTHEGTPGGTAVVHVQVQPSTNVGSVLLQVNYDPSLLRVLSATNPPGTVGGDYVMYYVVDGDNVRVVMACDSNTSNRAGTLVDILFCVNEGALPGMYSPLVIAQRELGGEYGVDLAQVQQVTHSNGTLWVVYSSMTDTDGDGLSDYQEQMLNSSPDYAPGRGDCDVTCSDTDGDGMPDGWEWSNGLNPLLTDSNTDKDGDGQLNLDEWITGSDPDDPSSVFTITEFYSIESAAGVVLQWQAVLGNLYSVYSKTNLLEDAWFTNIYRMPCSASGPMSYTNTTCASNVFFRVGAEPPP